MEEKNIWNSIKIKANQKSKEISKGSLEEFITEHYWGYAKVNNEESNEYQVSHPRWRQCSVEGCKMDVDFSKTYGENFNFLNRTEPVSIILAEGSEITAESISKIKNK